MIVTVDGPAGAGKSTVARALAKRLGFQFLDTGAMYRAVAWAALDRGVALEHPAELAALAHRVRIELDGDRGKTLGRDAGGGGDDESVVRGTEDRGGVGHANPLFRIER